MLGNVASVLLLHDTARMKHTLLAAALALATVGAGPLAQPSTAPATGANTSRLPSLGDGEEGFTPAVERRLGEQIMVEVRRDAAYLDDPLLLDYVQSLWQPLMAAARAQGHIGADADPLFAWEPFLVRDRAINAFALPGGHVGVYLGLMAVTGSSDELSSVLAHELAHVTQRHIARSISNSSRQSLVGLAALILGVMAASRSNSSDVAQAAIVGGQAAVAQGQLNFSRDMEREADRVGFGLHQHAGFAPAGMAAMFEKLDHASRLNDNGAFPYLRSHPLTIDRLSEARLRLEAPGTVRNAMASNLDHVLMQARAKALMDTRVDAMRRLQSAQAAQAGTASPSIAERIGVAYGKALASIELREPAAAQAALEAARQLLRETPATPRARLALAAAQAQVHVLRREGALALAAFEGLPADGRAALLSRSQIAAAVGDAKALRASTEALQTWVAERPSDALAWSQLAQCARGLGQPLRALRAEAESFAVVGDVPAAIDRFSAAQRLARSGSISAAENIEATVVDIRLRELQAKRREQLAEQKNSNRP
jgi:beta-barrel assembly-enhancing protease